MGAKTEDEIKDVEDAIHLLEKKNARDVLDGLGKLGSALELLPTAVQKCDDAAKDVKDQAPKLLKALETLKHPIEFAYHVGKDLIVNHADIFQEVSTAIDDYHSQKWEECGKITGAALSKLLVGEMSINLAASNDEQWPVVLKGVLEGFGLTKDVDEMKDCLAQTQSEIEDVEEALKLLEALETLKHPISFAYHVGKDLIVNHADIFTEVSEAIDDYHSQKWEECGKSTGAALSKLLVGEMSV